MGLLKGEKPRNFVNAWENNPPSEDQPKQLMPALDRIKIRGFKSIRELDLELKRLNVLIGGNGAGKSNFISAFSLLNNIVEQRLQAAVAKAGGADAMLYFGRKTTDKIEMHLLFKSNGYFAQLAPSADDGLYFEVEHGEFYGKQHDRPFREPVGAGHRESILPQAAQQEPGRVASHILNSLRSWKLYHFQDTSESAGVKALGPLDDNAFLRPNARNLAAFLLSLKMRAPSHYKKIVATIRQVTPFFDDFQLRESPLAPNKIKLEWRERDSDAYFNAHSMSDGTLRFVCLATLLLQPTLPETILLDEPELGLHPYAIRVLAELLQSASATTQVIVSTQSVSLVNQFSPEDLLVVEREAGNTVFKRPKSEDIQNWADDYGLGDLWEKNVIGGRPVR